MIFLQEALDRLRRNLAIALKSVRFNKRKYLPFFAAVLIFRLLFGILLFSSDLASAEEKKIVDRDYSYHVLYRNLNDQQYVYLLRYEQGENNPNGIFRIVEDLDSPGYSLSEPHHDLAVFLLGDSPRETYNAFKGRFHSSLTALADEGVPLGYSTTPLLDNPGNSVRGGTALACLFLFLLEWVVLTLLFSVRINNYKFEYGIYMTFGADFKKLTENAVFEMLIVALLTFLPSTAAAWLLSCLFHRRFLFLPGTLLLLLLPALISAVISVLFPMLVVSRIYPMKHILAADNSDYVSSPRRSFRMLGRSLTRHYEPFTVFRFRRYYLKLMAVTTAVTALAAVIFYAAAPAEAAERTDHAQFSLAFASRGIPYDETLRQELFSFDGVYATNKLHGILSDEINSHLLFGEGTVAPFSGFTVPPRNRYPDYSFGTDDVLYQSCDEEVIRFLSRYECEGDPAALLTTENGVILGESIRNTKKLTIHPGDTVYAAIPVGMNRDTTVSFDELNYSTGKKLFRLKLDFYDYRYVELTVVAVLKNIPTEGALPLYLSEQTYLSITDPQGEKEAQPIRYDTISIYTEPGMSEEEIRRLEGELMRWAAECGSFTVNNLHANAKAQIRSAMKTPVLCLAVALLIALIMPVIRFFSQLVFYRKRFPEMKILSALGAVTGEIKRLFLFDGLYNALLTALFTALLTPLLFRLLHAVSNRLASYGGVYLEFQFPLLIYLCVVSAAGIFTFLSAMISHRIYCREDGGKDDPFTAE